MHPRHFTRAPRIADGRSGAFLAQSPHPWQLLGSNERELEKKQKIGRGSRVERFNCLESSKEVAVVRVRVQKSADPSRHEMEDASAGRCGIFRIDARRTGFSPIQHARCCARRSKAATPWSRLPTHDLVASNSPRENRRRHIFLNSNMQLSGSVHGSSRLSRVQRSRHKGLPGRKERRNITHNVGQILGRCIPCSCCQPFR